MRWRIPLVVALVAFVAVSCDQQTLEPETDQVTTAQFSPGQGNMVIHHASAGTNDACETWGLDPGCDGNFSLVASMKADGTVTGQWQDSFGHGNGGYHIAIDCLMVFDNQAVVSGVVTQAAADYPEEVGTNALTSIVDGGEDAPDQISLTFSGFDPEFDCTTFPPEAFPLFEVTRGQVNVR